MILRLGGRFSLVRTCLGRGRLVDLCVGIIISVEWRCE